MAIAAIDVHHPCQVTIGCARHEVEGPLPLVCGDRGRRGGSMTVPHDGDWRQRPVELDETTPRAPYKRQAVEVILLGERRWIQESWATWLEAQVNLWPRQ
jgi:hypothetical protein